MFSFLFVCFASECIIVSLWVGRSVVQTCCTNKHSSTFFIHSPLITNLSWPGSLGIDSLSWEYWMLGRNTPWMDSHSFICLYVWMYAWMRSVQIGFTGNQAGPDYFRAAANYYFHNRLNGLLFYRCIDLIGWGGQTFSTIFLFIQNKIQIWVLQI